MSYSPTMSMSSYYKLNCIGLPKKTMAKKFSNTLFLMVHFEHYVEVTLKRMPTNSHWSISTLSA